MKTRVQVYEGRATISQVVCTQTVKLNDRRICRNDTGKLFGVETSGWMETNGGRITRTEGSKLSKGHITDWWQDICRSLGVQS